MRVRQLGEIEDLRLDVTHPPGARSPTESLSRRGFADGDGPAAWTGEPDPASRPRRTRAGAGAPSALGGRSPRQRPGAGRIPLNTAQGGGKVKAPVYTEPVPSNGPFLSPTFARSWPSIRSSGQSFAAGRPPWAGSSIGAGRHPRNRPRTHTPKGATFLVRCGLLYRRGEGAADPR